MNDLAARVGHQPLALLPAFARMPSTPTGLGGAALIDGVGIIPVEGMLWQDDYRFIGQAATIAAADPAVKVIALVINSPGGVAAGCFDLADAIFALRGTKPIRAILAEDAFSSAYAIASACDHITVPRTGGVGSVGVWSMYVDMSPSMKAAGLMPTIFRSASQKNEASQLEPLSAAAKARIQAEIDTLGDIFAATVVRNRGLSVDAVKATKGGTFMGAAGVKAGFADAVGAPDDAILAILSSLADGAPLARRPLAARVSVCPTPPKPAASSLSHFAHFAPATPIHREEPRLSYSDDIAVPRTAPSMNRVQARMAIARDAAPASPSRAVRSDDDTPEAVAARIIATAKRLGTIR